MVKPLKTEDQGKVRWFGATGKYLIQVCDMRDLQQKNPEAFRSFGMSLAHNRFIATAYAAHESGGLGREISVGHGHTEESALKNACERAGLTLTGQE